MSSGLFVVLLLIFRTVFAQRGSPCVTPNNENAKCVGVRSCNVIADALLTIDQAAKDFAKASKCGFDKELLVCCGSSGYYKLPDFFGEIFTKEPKPFDPNDIFTQEPKPFDPNDIFTQEPKPFDPNDIFTSEPGRNDIPTKSPETSTESSNGQGSVNTNLNTNVLPDRTVCGLDNGQSKITGGEVTEIDEFPWMAALEFKKISNGENAGIRCGGTIINNRHVLTAAHCMLNTQFELTSVWLGEWRISTDPDCDTVMGFTACTDKVQKIKIEETIPHPYYSARMGDNDIGLLRLEKDIQYSSFIRPICLPQSALPLPAEGTNLTVVGWGATENGTSSDIKLKVSVPLLSNKRCMEKLSNTKKAGVHQLCAGGEEGKDSCHGDSGGPLMRFYEDKTAQQVQWYQEGVVSNGVGCGRVGFPAIYTRVSRYISWIVYYVKAAPNRTPS